MVAVAALAGSLLFKLSLHRDAGARGASAAQAAANGQITALHGPNTGYTLRAQGGYPGTVATGLPPVTGLGYPRLMVDI